jgi:hypothetical protein
MSKVTRRLTQAQKVSRDADAVLSGDPKRLARRVTNRLLGRALAKAGFWRWLWR